MKMFKNGLLIIALSVFAWSCNNDDDYSLGDYWITTGTIVETSDYFFVETDNGTTLWPSATNVNPAELEDGMRVFVNYTILSDGKEGEAYDHYVKINGIKDILTKPIFNFTAETTQHVKDSIGNDAVTIKDTWFTNDYLNLEYEYGGGYYIHYINLVKDSEFPETENGEIILELKHNKNEDPANYKQWAIISVDISELKMEGKTSVDLLLRSKNSSGEYVYNKVVTYDYAGETMATSAATTQSATVDKLSDFVE